MRIWILALSLFATTAHANIVADVYPAKPIVIDSDFATINNGIIFGRWFAANLYFKNQYGTSVVIEAVSFETKSDEGDIGGNSPAWTPQEIAAGDSLKIDKVFVDQLPDSKSFIYTVTMKIVGWKGTLTAPGERFTQTKQFHTQ